MTALGADFYKMCEANRDGSYATQAGRLTTLNQIADIFHAAGLKVRSARGLKQRHTDKLVSAIKELQPATQKNIMAHYRWALKKAGKNGLVPDRNADLGIPDRHNTGENKAITLDMEAVERMTCDHSKMSVRLMAAFGLRREEAIKIRPAMADHGDHLTLHGPWTKGGKARDIPIVSERQRALLDEAKALVGNGALIPDDKNYKKQRERLEDQTRRHAGMKGKHGLRHKYAQVRYHMLTGWKCPKDGGPVKLTPAQQRIDAEVRQELSRELGHERPEITKDYLG